jgi:hypothetical protein
MASRQAKYEVPPGRGPYCMRIHGQVFHHLGGLRSTNGNAKYSQIYILDAAQALAQRLRNARAYEPKVLEGTFISLSQHIS